jgi:amino acid adenylation domain-containing protein
MMERLVLHYKRLLEVAVDAPETSIGALDFLLAGEREELLEKFNSTAVAYPADKTVVDLFVEQAARTPDATALVFEEQRMSYRELDEKSNQLARYLQAQGVGRESLVPLCMERSMDMVLGLLGILKAGGAYVPIDVNCPQQRLDFILGDTGCGQVLTHAGLSELFEGHEDELKVIELDMISDALDAHSGLTLTDLPAAEQLVYVIYTSGTTGVPKGVMIEHKSLLDYVAGLVSELALDTAYAYGLMSTPSADLGNTVLYGALVTGGLLHTFSKDTLMNAAGLLSYFNTHQVDIIKIVPSHWLSLSHGEDVLLPREMIVFGGEALNGEVIKKIKGKDASLRVVNHYGPTETTIGKLLYKADLTGEEEHVTVPIGKPFSRAGAHILDEQQALVPVGVVGELCIEGIGLARGYLNRTDQTEEKFIRHPFKPEERLYRTGDLAYRLADGNIVFKGRKDSQVKIRGYRVELEEIEAVLNQLYNIEQAVVQAVEDSSGSKQLIAYVVSKELVDANSIREGLMLILEEKLPEYMVPNIYVKLEAMPLTANGKVDRKALPVPGSQSRQQAYVAPQTELEIQLAEIWQQVLGIEKVGLHDNFFDLGGNSLNAIKVSSRMKKEMNLDMEIKSLFHSKTINDLACQIDLFLKHEKIKVENPTLNKIEL